jgi:hypothetical protein
VPVFQEPGLFPTTYLKLVLSARAASPGSKFSLRAEGIDLGSFIGGKVLTVDREEGGEWTYVGMLIGSRSADAGSTWMPKESTARFAVTMEGYRGDQRMYFRAPFVKPGDYRLRFDLIHSNLDIGGVQARRATLYAYLRVLPPR